MTTISSGHHPASQAMFNGAASGMGAHGSRASRTGDASAPPAFPMLDSATPTSLDARSTLSQSGSDTQTDVQTASTSPWSRSRQDAGQANAFGPMGMDTQSFAMMMGGEMPPPPMGSEGGASSSDGGLMPMASLDTNQDGSISRAEFGLSNDDSTHTGTDESGEALFSLIDRDQDGSLSKTELNSFQNELENLVGQMQQMPPLPPMNAHGFGATASSLDMNAA